MSIIYRFTGGLGNILFSFVELENLNNFFQEQIVVDLSHIENRSKQVELLVRKILETEFKDNVILTNKKHFATDTSLNLNGFSPDKFTYGARLIYSDSIISLIKKRQHSANLIFHGWIGDAVRVKNSRIFKIGVLNLFGSFIRKPIEYQNNSLHLRLGDFLRVNYLGRGTIVSKNYIKKCFYRLNIERRDQVKVYSDDGKMAKKLLTEWFPQNLFEYEQNFESNEINSLVELSTSRKIICSSSTFSFWAAMFSKGEVCWPEPTFYNHINLYSELPDNKWIKVRKHSKLQYFVYKIINTKYFLRLILKLERVVRSL